MKTIYWSGRKDKKDIALTFDDGPSDKTLEILKILRKNKSKATFFFLGKKIRNNKKKIIEVIKQGSEVASHLFNHKLSLFKSKKFIENELLSTDKEFKKIKVKTVLVRPPYGWFGLNLLTTCKRLNKKIILFSIDSRDWRGIKSEKIINKILKKVRNGSIIVMHEYIEGIGKNKEIIPALRKLLPELRKKNFRLVTVSNLLKNE